MKEMPYRSLFTSRLLLDWKKEKNPRDSFTKGVPEWRGTCRGYDGKRIRGGNSGEGSEGSLEELLKKS
jgi:hypothetical protein